MIRRAFTMRLKPKALKEYKKHHDNIWPELVKEIEKSGIAQITIFERDPMLFLYSEIYDEQAWDKLWHSKIHDKWGEIMNPLMHFNEEGIVDSVQVGEVFHLETKAAENAAKKAPAKKPTAKKPAPKAAAKTTAKPTAKPGAKPAAKTTRKPGK